MTAPPAPRFGSNAVRLSCRQWLVASAIAAGVFWLVPAAWQRFEPLPDGPDVRIPYRLGEDYWTYRRFCREACSRDSVLVLGDSVIWGHYVKSGETLSHYLNERAGRPRFANLGVDGIHPVAMEGLIEHYAGDIAGKKVLLFCNPLWMSSPAHDLQGEKERPINHPKLIPQFSPRLACYRETFDGRLGVLVQRHSTFLSWVNHLRIAYFDNADLGTWALDHPYENPATAVTAKHLEPVGSPPAAQPGESPAKAALLKLPSPDEPPSPPPTTEPWTARRIDRYSPAWVELERSVQWQSFLRTVETLQGRGNQVFVLVGPFNEHMLKPRSLETYGRLKAAIAAELAERQVPHWVAAVLPTDLYADASHPLAPGYAMLAEKLWENGSFAAFRDKE